MIQVLHRLCGVVEQFDYRKESGLKMQLLDQSKAIDNKKQSIYWMVSLLSLLSVLMLRGNGAFSRLEIEETFNSGFMMSHNVFGVFTAQMYQAVTSKLLAEIALLFPLDFLPRVSFYLATTFSLACLVCIQLVILKNTYSKATALIATICVSLIPAPLHGVQGLVYGVYWIQLMLFVCVAATPQTLFSPSTRRVILLFGAITAMSHPAAGIVGLYLLAISYFFSGEERKLKLRLGVSTCFGLVVQIGAYFNRQSQLGYLGQWTPNTAKEVDALKLLSDAGATDIRSTKGVFNPELMSNIFGSSKFLVSSVFPEPWNSRILQNRSFMANLIFVAIPLLIVLAPFFVTQTQSFRKNLMATSNFVRQLLLLTMTVVAFQYLILGSLDKFQHTMLFVNTIWIVVAISITLSFAHKLRYALLASVITAVALAPSIPQNFRDDRLRGSENAWKVGLAQAVKECKSSDPNEVVVIIQEEGPVGDESAPFFLRCSVLLDNL
jgi:hypothetical protein